MPIVVDLNVKIPGLTIRTPDQPPQVINNQAVRFLKTAAVPALPTVGSIVEVTAVPDITIHCRVTRVEWSDAENRFIVSCTFARNSITPVEYRALSDDPAWRQNRLPV